MAKEFAQAFYLSKRWKDCRRGYIKSVNGLCERCLAKGHYVPGYIVHHKVVLTPSNINDPSVSLSWDKLEYLCQECHNTEHMSKYGNTAVGLRFDESGQLIDK